jgi:hypothetical protein
LKRILEKKLRLKWGDIKTRVKSDLTATVREDKQNINMLTNMHGTPSQDNFCDDYGNAVKPAIFTRL